MSCDVDHISQFYRSIHGETPTTGTYLLLNPGGDHAYLFRPKRESIRSVASKIAGQGLKRTLGELSLRVASYFPNIASLIPMISWQSVPVARDDSFDVAVISNRTRLINFRTDVVYTLPTDDTQGVRTAIEKRSNLPEGINVPELVDADIDYPYFVERRIKGDSIRSPIKEWDVVLDALRQLESLYRSIPVEFVSREQYVDEVVIKLRSNGVIECPLIDRGLDRLRTMELPDELTRTRIHGDVHARNLLVEHGDVYIIDWESSRRDFVICDFFRSFAVLHYDTRDPRLFYEMVTGTGRGGEIYMEFARTLGEIAYGDRSPHSGLPLLYVLHSLGRIDSNRSLWKSYYELLDGLLNRLD